MSNSKNILKTLFFVASFALVTTAYQNCGSPSGNGVSDGASTANSINGDIVPIPNTKTASIQRASRTLDNIVSCLGTVAPRNSAQQRYNASRGTISEEGLANTITQPMAKAMVSIAGEECLNLYEQERNAGEGNRRIFKEVDFADQAGLSRSSIGTAAKRLARSCWGRNATESELEMLVSNVASAFEAEEDNGDKARDTMVYLCTAVAASFATYEM